MKLYSPLLTREPYTMAVRDYNRAGAKDFANSMAKRIKHSARQEERDLIAIGIEDYQAMQTDELYRQWNGVYPREDMTLQQVSDAIMEEINRDYSIDWFEDMEREREQYYLDREQQDDGIDPTSEREDMSCYDLVD